MRFVLALYLSHTTKYCHAEAQPVPRLMRESISIFLNIGTPTKYCHAEAQPVRAWCGKHLNFFKHRGRWGNSL